MQGRRDLATLVARAAVCAVLFAMCSSVALAVPAGGGIGTVKQPDGTEIQGRLFGDEFYNWNETADGYVIIRGDDGWWRYAVKDANGDLVASPARVNVDPRPAGRSCRW